jgi:hypothetical protein
MALHTDLTPDSVEFCPLPHATTLFLVGMYELDTQKQERHGSLWLCQVVRTEAQTTISVRQRLPSPAGGLLDLKWCGVSRFHSVTLNTRHRSFQQLCDRTLVAGATSSGKIALWSLNTMEGKDGKGG